MELLKAREFNNKLTNYIEQKIEKVTLKIKKDGHGMHVQDLPLYL